MSTPQNSSPYAELDKIFANVRDHNLAHIKAAIVNAVDRYQRDALDNLYTEAVLWSKTFLHKAVSEDERLKRKILTDYVLSRGTARRQAQNAIDSLSRVDPAS